MKGNGWLAALTAGTVAAVGIAVLGLAYVLITDRPVYGGDGPVVRSVVFVTLGTFLGGTLGRRIGQVIRQRKPPDGG